MELVLPPYAEIHGVPSMPSPEQAQFHRLARSCTYAYMMGGMGSGKSWAGAQQFLRMILFNRAKAQAMGYGDDEIAYIAGAPTYQLVKAGPWSHLLKILRDIERINGFSLMATKPNKSNPPEIRLITGDVIEFISTDSGRYAGRTAAGWWYDECDHPLNSDPIGGFNILDDRLRDARIGHLSGICTSTPPTSTVGVAHMFKDQQAMGNTRFALVHAHSDSNPMNKGTDYVSRRMATMSERERKIRLAGEVLQPSGTTYAEEFDASESMAWGWKWFRNPLGAPKPRSDRSYFLALDWPGSAHALLVEFDKATGEYVVFDEVVTEGQSYSAFCATVADRCERQWGIRTDHIDLVYCDYQPKVGPKEARKMWGSNKVRARWVRGDRGEKQSGIETVRWALLDGEGNRRLKFAPHLRDSPSKRGIIACVSNYSEVKTVKEGMIVTTGKYDNASPWGHGADALRYMLWQRESHRRFYDAGRAAA